MKILLSEYDVSKAIASFYKVDETYIKTDDQGYFEIDLPVENQITIADFKSIEEILK